MNPLRPGVVLLSPGDINAGLYFVFHHSIEGSAALDLITPHPDIPYKNFEVVLDFKDEKPQAEKTVFRGGPQRTDDALFILHETFDGAKDSHFLNHDFSFLSYNYVLLPGKPPAIQTSGNRPTRITLKPSIRFLIVMGYRTWEGDALEREITAGLWTALLASKEDIFDVETAERRNRFLRKLN